MQGNNDFFDSRHFRIRPLADGVYAAIAVDGGAASCNSGIIDLGDFTVIFDSFLTPQAAIDLLAASEKLSGSPVQYVINSHRHSDHIRGNQVFRQAKIVSTAKTREWLALKGQEDIRLDAEEATRELRALETGQNATMQDEIDLWRGCYRGVLESIPTLELKLPNLTFDTRMIFHGASRTAEIVTYGGGHTESDAILLLPNERSAFMGDLLFIEMHPWLSSGDPTEFVRILEKVETLDLKTFVPGHGLVGMSGDIALNRKYVADLERLAAAAFNEGRSEEQVAHMAIPSAFATWRFRVFFEANMRFLYKRIETAMNRTNRGVC